MENPMYLYTQQQMEELEAYIAQTCGAYTQVLHEIFSPDIHLDVILLPPGDRCNYYRLVTMGMGAFPMPVPESLAGQELERAELVLCLPPDWKLDSAQEEDYWPVRQLKSLARIPIQCDTWLGYGHTVSQDAENTPYAANTGFCSMVLLTGLDADWQPLELRLSTGEKINFYQVMPLYKEELRFKQKKGLDALLDRFSNDDLCPVINLQRKNYGLPVRRWPWQRK